MLLGVFGILLQQAPDMATVSFSRCHQALSTSLPRGDVANAECMKWEKDFRCPAMLRQRHGSKSNLVCLLARLPPLQVLEVHHVVPKRISGTTFFGSSTELHQMR